MQYQREHGCRAWLTYGQLSYQTLRMLLETYGSAAELYNSLHESPSWVDKLTPLQRQRLFQHGTPEAMHTLMVTMQKHDIGILSIEDAEYPMALKQIDDPPLLLFYRGDLSCLERRCIAMVGSRKASVHGVDAARRIAAGLAEQGITIVSGLAMGIDGACHQGAIDAGAPTCAVMGCGLDIAYPAEHQKLHQAILDGDGVLLSEYPPEAPALSWHFPVRNRILSGLCRAVVFVEGQVKSGSMSTIAHALEQGRDVFAYPGRVDTPWSEGACTLIREGAVLCTSARDILESMGWDRRDARPATREEMKSLPPLNPIQQRVLAQLSMDDLSFDQLTAALQVAPAELSTALTMLQLMGLIRPLPGKIYSKI